MCRFSPTCLLVMCFLWVLEEAVVNSHWLQWCSLSPVCFKIFSPRCSNWLAKKLHFEHLYAFSPVWMRECRFKWLFWLKDLLQCGQLYLLAPLWVCLCCQRPLLPPNVIGQWSQNIKTFIIDWQNFFLALLASYWIKIGEFYLEPLSLLIAANLNVVITFTFYNFHFKLHPNLMANLTASRSINNKVIFLILYIVIFIHLWIG